jgi:NlpC/P60 family putative phage cell wall peptidase
MMGARAVKEARGWIGTPYVHQASVCGVGTDCLGLVRGVWRGLYGSEPEVPPAYTRDWSEASGEEMLWGAAIRHLREVPLGDASPGDVLLFRMRDGSVAKHMGIQARIGREASFIHAFSGHAVLESALTRPWARRVVARFQFPERG